MANRVISAVLKFKDENFSDGLRNANSQAGEFGQQVQGVQNRVEKFKSTASNAFKAVGVAAGALTAAGITALGAAVGQTVVEINTALNRLEARTGETGHAIEEYMAIAKDAFTSGLGEGIGEVTDSVATIATMFRDVDYGELSEITKGAYTIAEVWDTEAKEVGRSVQAMVNNFSGLSSTDALDLITTTFQRTGDASDDLLATFSEYSMHFSKLGLSAQEFAGILVRSMENGAFSTDFAADAVKELGIRVIDESKTTAEGFKAIGFDADEMAKKFSQGGEVANSAFQATVAGLAAMDDPIKRNAAGVALWGTKWEDIREEVILSMADSASAVEGFQGATGRAADAMNESFGRRLTNAWRTLQVEIANVANSSGAQEFLGTVASKAEELVPKIITLAEKAFEFGNTIKENWGPIKETIIGITVAVAAFKVGMTAMTIISAVTGFIQAYRAALAAGTVAQWAMNVAMSANPIGLVIAGIAGLIAIGVLLYRNWDTVKEKAGELWAKTKEVFGGIYDWGVDKIQPVVSFFGGLYDKFVGFKDAITSFKLPDWVSSIGSTISGAAGKVAEWAGASFDVGSNRIGHDQIAQVHKDEMIIPARQAEKVRQAGGNINNIDKLISRPSPVTVTNSNENKAGTGTIQVIIQNVNAAGVTVAEVAGEIVSELKLVLANM